MAPFTQQQLGEFLGSAGIATNRLRVEGESVITIRATAQLRLQNGQLSDLKRTVAAVVKYMPPGQRFGGPHPALVRHSVEKLRTE